MNEIKLHRSFELKPNEDMTQNLYIKHYQNNLLISAFDLGNIEDIVSLIKEKEDLIKYIEKFISKTNYEVDIKGNYVYLAWTRAYEDLLERIKSNNYEKSNTK